MVLRNGMPRLMFSRLVWIKPPSTSVWLFKSTTDVSASRFENVGDASAPVCRVKMSFTSCLTSSATVPSSPMRGVTVSTIPTSLYSTVWVPTIVVLFVLVVPTGWLMTPPTVDCCDVRTGTDLETLITAFLFSVVMTYGQERMLTLSSEANARIAARNWLAENAKNVRPGASTELPSLTKSGKLGRLMMSGPFGGFPVYMRLNFPSLIAHSMPRLVESSSVTSATRTSMRTWRGIRSSFLIIGSISVHVRG